MGKQNSAIKSALRAQKGRKLPRETSSSVDENEKKLRGVKSSRFLPPRRKNSVFALPDFFSSHLTFLNAIHTKKFFQPL